MRAPSGAGWDRALTALRRVLPEAANFLPDDIATAAETAGIVLSWEPVPDHDTRSDSELWHDLRRLAPGGASSDEVILVADPCYTSDGPYALRRNELGGFLDRFSTENDDSIFGGDVVVVFPDGILVFHHEGIATFVPAR